MTTAKKLRKFGTAPGGGKKPSLNSFGGKPKKGSTSPGGIPLEGYDTFDPAEVPADIREDGKPHEGDVDSGGESFTFVGEVIEIREGDVGHYFTLEDSSGVWFKYAAYLCDSMKKVLR